ncbi:hypothetical protein ACFC1W_08575 [Microbacterium sp. NPDC056003]|uniref:hypothetical protein n=1 Tax=Microbacterium sp. NPDC056003 TaxID=3345676 RepID=UPI0035DF3849
MSAPIVPSAPQRGTAVDAARTAMELAGARHEVLPPRMPRGADVLYRSFARAAPP